MRIPLAVLAFVACSLCARSQGLVQLTLEGEIEATGGARIEADVTFVDSRSGRAQTMSLAVLLAERTTAVDLTGLLARRLDQAGARVIFTGSTAPMRGPTSLFVEDVTGIGLRLGRGLGATVTMCEDRPASLKLLPGLESRLTARLLVAAQTFEPHAKQPGRVVLEFTFDDKSDATDVGTKMVKTAIDKGWFSELDAHETWRPGALTDVGTVTSFSVQLRSNADWRLELALAPRVTQR